MERLRDGLRAAGGRPMLADNGLFGKWKREDSKARGLVDRRIALGTVDWKNCRTACASLFISEAMYATCFQGNGPEQDDGLR